MANDYDPFRELMAVRAALNQLDLPDWNDWTGSDLLEFWLGLKYPRKLRRVTDRVYSGEATRVIMAGPRGGGKSLSPETQVVMYDGTVRRVDAVRVGDKLMGIDSTPRIVLETHSGRDKMYRVTPTKGDSYDVNSSHILSLRLGTHRANVSKALRAIIPIDAKKGDIINLPISDFIKLAPDNPSHLVGWRTGVMFATQTVPLSPYFVGLWLGDGDCYRPAITSADPEIAAYMAGFADASELKLTVMPYPMGKASLYSLVTRSSAGYNFHGKGSNPVRDALLMLGLMRRRGEPNDKKHIPQIYKSNSREVRLQLLAGLIDSDGHLHHNGYQIIAKQKRLADDIAFLARSLGYCVNITEVTKTIRASNFSGQYYSVSIYGDLAEIPVLLPRKKAHARRQIKNHQNVGLRVKPIGEGEYYGIGVDGDNLYLLGDFTVTHNSMWDAAIEFILWVFRDFDVVNMGGSEMQAANVYDYLRGFMAQFDRGVREWNMTGKAPSVTLLKETMQRTVRKVDPLNLHTPTLIGEDGETYEFTGVPLAKDSQAFVAVLAASAKQVRGPHAGSERRGGLLVVDEEGEVEGSLYNAAKYTVNTARPSIILRTSTYHNAVGTFAEDFENPEIKGFERHRFSLFDVAKVCPYAVTTPDDWARLERGEARAPGDEDKSVIDLPVLQPDCKNCPEPQYFRDVRFVRDARTNELRPLSQAWCGGAAAYAENGWIDWPEILQLFRERPNDEDFEVELLGLRPTSLGYVITDRDSIGRAIYPDAECQHLPPVRRDSRGRAVGRNEGAGECIITIDWGLSGTCAVMCMQNRYDLNPPYGVRVLIDIADLGHMGDTLVYDHCDDLRRRFEVNEVWADSSHPYQNKNLAERGYDVHIVYFAKYKEHGVGSINMHLAHDAFRFPEDAGRTLVKQLRGWRRDKNGQIVKKDDHFPDSLLCGALRYLDMVMFMMDEEKATTGLRKSGVVNAAARHADDLSSGAEGTGGFDRMGQRQRDTMPTPTEYRAHELLGISADTGAGPRLDAEPYVSYDHLSVQEVLPHAFIGNTPSAASFGGESFGEPGASGWDESPPLYVSPLMQSGPETPTEKIIRETSEQARQTPRRFR